MLKVEAGGGAASPEAASQLSLPPGYPPPPAPSAGQLDSEEGSAVSRTEVSGGARWSEYTTAPPPPGESITFPHLGLRDALLPFASHLAQGWSGSSESFLSFK